MKHKGPSSNESYRYLGLDRKSIARDKINTMLDITQREKNRAAEKQGNHDTEKRMGIHQVIKMCLRNGKTTDEIIEELKAKYPNSSLEPYYKGYINDHIRKMSIDEERDDR